MKDKKRPKLNVGVEITVIPNRINNYLFAEDFCEPPTLEVQTTSAVTKVSFRSIACSRMVFLKKYEKNFQGNHFVIPPLKGIFFPLSLEYHTKPRSIKSRSRCMYFPRDFFIYDYLNLN